MEGVQAALEERMEGVQAALEERMEGVQAAQEEVEERMGGMVDRLFALENIVNQLDTRMLQLHGPVQ